MENGELRIENGEWRMSDALGSSADLLREMNLKSEIWNLESYSLCFLLPSKPFLLQWSHLFCGVLEDKTCCGVFIFQEE